MIDVDAIGRVHGCIGHAKEIGETNVYGGFTKANFRFTDLDVISYQRRVLARLPRYQAEAPLVAQKILSIAALLSIHALPSGSNPIKIFTFLLNGGNPTPEEDTVTPFDYALLSSQDIHTILIFATSLIEQVPQVKFSQQDR